MKITPAQIVKFEQLINGYERNDSQIDYHIKSLSKLIDHFLEELCYCKKDEYTPVAEKITELWHIKSNLLELIEK